jgi:hypothetical protein
MGSAYQRGIRDKKQRNRVIKKMQGKNPGKTKGLLATEAEKDEATMAP